VLVEPVIVAVSNTEPPTVMVNAERFVEIFTPPFGLTVRGAHALVIPLLFVSPVYAAFQLYGPAVLNV
jgi:hypothetical protein